MSSILIKFKILNNVETDIQIKDTDTGLYVQYDSYEHWNTKTAWACSLYDGAQKICSNQQLFMTQINYLKTFMSQNGYPCYIWVKINKQLQSRQKGQQNNNARDKEDLPVIFYRIPYAGAQGDRLLKNLTKKLSGSSLSLSY